MPAKKTVAKAPPPMPAMEMPDYGIKPRVPTNNLLELEMAFFRMPEGSRISKVVDGQTLYNSKGKPRWYHAQRIIDMLWNFPGSQKPFKWHPDAIRMLKAACNPKNKRLGVPGAGSTGKSDFFAVWAIIIYLAYPKSAMVLVTTTTKSAAANRIWGKIIAYWNALPALPPGKLLTSKYAICYHDPITGETDETCGIKLVAGEASKAAKSADEIRGIKGSPLLLVADEMPELSHSLTNTFNENLTANYNHQFVALGNPDTYFDPFGEFCEPEGGWDSVGDDDYEWRTKNGGKVIRLDAEQSPNVLEGKVIFPFLMREDQLADKERDLGGRFTPAYYRGVRGMWCKTGHELTIYTQPEIVSSNAQKKAVWRGETTMVAGFDVAFTHEGDRSVLVICRIGTTVEGKLTIEVVKVIDINEDTRVKDIDRTTQVVRKLRLECEAHDVAPENLAIDATGPGGKAFRDAVISQWSNKFLAVDFGGSPSEKPVSKLDPTPCNKRYDRRVSELWFGAKSFLRGDQLRGITNEIAAEMVVRRYKESKPGSDDRKISVETKREMKIRTKKSPDTVDGYMCCIELCRTRHKFVSDDKPAERKASGGVNPVRKKFQSLQNIYRVAG